MSTRRSLHRNLAFAAVGSFLVGASSVHCGSSVSTSSDGFAGSTTGNGGSAGTASGGMGGGIGSGSSNGGSAGTFMLSDASGFDYSLDSFYVNDPPPTSCDGGGMAPPAPGGTPTCPDDKNLPGCPCSPMGTTAACWTGLRADRDHGDCMDGTTTCMLSGETALAWGPCNGEVLPVAGATGAAACQCFSDGHWAIANLSPCFYTNTDNMGNMTAGAISTIGATMMCPTDFTAAPSQSWSTDTLQVDCTGSFTLCYTIKAGDPKNPLPTDCTIVQDCSSSYYSTANAVQMWPDLPGWLSAPSAAACITQFTTTGGYGQMSVQGQSDECQLVDKVFQTVTYCPLSCDMPNPPASCAQCSPGGGGSF
jgi:hypothetical protein